MRSWRTAAAILLVLGLMFSIGPLLFADEFHVGTSMSSDNFRILDPQHAAFGGVASSSSPSFRLVTTIGDLAIGTSSLISLALRTGFLYFPTIVAPTLTSATPGASQVSLAWLAAQAFQGLTVGAYNVCTKPSGGSYTCEDVGNVMSSIKSGLTNGTTYTFKIEAKDVLTNVIADSNELSAVPAGEEGGVGAPPPGIGGIPPQPTEVSLSGYAYPGASVYILRDAIRIGSAAIADGSGKFSYDDRFVAAGTYRYSIYAVDTDGHRSSNHTFSATVQANERLVVDQLVLPPTTTLENSQLAQGDTLTIRGQTFSGSRVVAEILPEKRRVSTQAESGRYVITYPVANLATGVHYARLQTVISESLESIFSDAIGFGVDALFKKRTFEIPGCGVLEEPDLDCDGRIGIVDVSILMYYYRHAVPPEATFVDFNGDEFVDIIDFSTLVFYWTG